MPVINYKEPSNGDKFVSIFLRSLAVVIIVFSGFFVLEKYGLIIYLFVIIFTISLLIFWHAQTRAYRCKNCGHEFEIKFFTDLISAHSFEKKMLTCPACHFKDYATELVKSRNK